MSSSPGHKEKWTEPSSNRPLKWLSPASCSTRLSKGSDQRRRMRKTILSYEDLLDVELTGEQDEELQRLVKAIDEHGEEHLETVITEAEQSGEGTGDELRQVWDRDVTSRKEFF